MNQQQQASFVFETIAAMRRQEESAYAVEDYLNGQSKSTSPRPAVDAQCRFLMVQWCYNVVDYCKLNCETVEIPISYLDQYLCSNQ